MASPAPTIRYVLPSELHPISTSSFAIDNLRNPSPSDLDIVELAQSIIDQGVRVPLIAFTDPTTKQLTIKDGHRRHVAALLASDLHPDLNLKIPVVIERTPVTALSLLIDQVTTNSSAPPTPLQLATRVELALRHGANVPSLAKAFGKSTTYLYSLIELLNAPPEIIEAVRQNVLSATAATELLKDSPSPADAVTALATATKDNNGNKVTSKHLKLSPPSSAKKLQKRISDALKSYPNAKAMKSCLETATNSNDGSEI